MNVSYAWNVAECSVENAVTAWLGKQKPQKALVESSLHNDTQICSCLEAVFDHKVNNDYSQSWTSDVHIAIVYTLL